LVDISANTVAATVNIAVTKYDSHNLSLRFADMLNVNIGRENRKA